MTPQEIQAAIVNLQNQLLYTHGNIEAQNNINQRIAQLTMLLQQYQQPIQQVQPMGIYSPMQQPMYPQQQMLPQQIFQQALGQANQNNSVTTNTMVDNTRYGSRKDTHLDRYAVNKPEPVQQQVMSKPKIPLDGYELDLFLEFGLVCEIVELGDFYKYEVKTTPIYTPSHDHKLVISEKPISRVSADAYNNNDNIITVSNHVIHRNSNDNVVNDTFNTGTLDQILSSIESDSIFGITLDKLITSIVNKLLRYYVGYVLNETSNTRDIISLDNASDIKELRNAINNINIMDTRKRINNVITYITNYIKNIAIKKSDDNIVTLTVKYDTLFICNEDDIRSVLLDFTGVKIVTHESYGLLYNMLTQLLKDGKSFNNTSIARIAYNNEIGGVVYINTYATSNGMFIIERDQK